MELLQDAVVVLLSVTLFGMGFVFLYRVWREIIALGNLQEGLSNVIFVVITIELYRLLVHYLRYHKVDLNILVFSQAATEIRDLARERTRGKFR